MAHSAETDAGPTSAEQLELPAEFSAVREFARVFKEKFRGAYSSDGAVEDLRVTVGEDLPNDLATGELRRAQSLLEDGWGGDNRSRSLDTERRDALAELHAVEAGELTPERRRAASATTEAAMKEACLRDRDREQVRAYNNLFVRGGVSVEEQRAAITVIENLITDESVLHPNGTKIEALRTMRDICHEKVTSEVEMAANQVEFTERVKIIVGENPDFPMDGIERAMAYLTGASADRMRQILGEAERSKDPVERSNLLLELANGGIPVHEDAEYAQWRHERNTRLAERAAHQQARDLAKARARLERLGSHEAIE